MNSRQSTMSFSAKLKLIGSVLIGALIFEVRCGVLEHNSIAGIVKPLKPLKYPVLEAPGLNRFLPKAAEQQKFPKPNPVMSLIHPLTPKLNETEEERVERIHKAFERMLTLVNIASQVDDYVSSKVKTVARKVSDLVNSGEDKVVAIAKSHCHHQH